MTEESTSPVLESGWSMAALVFGPERDPESLRCAGGPGVR